MKKASFLKQIVLIVIILGFASTAFSAEVLYYVDDIQGQVDMMSLALEKPKLNLNVTRANDLDNFNSLVDSKHWDLVVLALQYDPTDPLSRDIINEYLNEDGRAIVFIWEAKSDLYKIFGAKLTGTKNSTDVTLTPEGIGKGLAPKTFSVYSSKWDDYSRGMDANMTDDIVAATFSNGPAFGKAAIIISNEGRTIINGFNNTTPSDETIFVSEIKFLLPAPELESSGGGGCNTGGVVPFALMLLTPLFFFKRKK